jgi:hypothetical protein
MGPAAGRTNAVAHLDRYPSHPEHPPIATSVAEPQPKPVALADAEPVAIAKSVAVTEPDSCAHVVRVLKRGRLLDDDAGGLDGHADRRQ